MSQPSHLSLMPPKTPYYALVVTQMDPPSFPACFERHQSGDTTLLFFSHVTPAYQAYAALYPHVTWVTTTSTVFVGGLRHPVHPSEIAQVFHSIGWVHQVHVLPHKRCAFVSFFLNEHAQAAVTLQRVKIGENWVRLGWGKASSVGVGKGGKRVAETVTAKSTW
ncbi:hypothetical protein HMI54_013684 [Coelomomyces lativittatus]|nr:hypothetical protein HMI54_013684 [Coelomomyces lativittatus]KAJ1500152.1 hypothetical protein HMI56_003996 [Coelomomyces lativittatus]